MSPISATVTEASTLPMPGRLLERVVSVVVFQQVSDHRVQQRDLGGQLCGQAPQRGQLPAYGCGSP